MINSKYLALLSTGLIVLLSSPSCYSQVVTVPNRFASGTPAKAADVNANFNALANAINGLATQISTQSSGGSSGASCQLGKNSLGLTYVPTNNLVNTSVYGHVLASYPIIDLVNGARYSITFPTESATNSWSSSAYADIEVTRSKDSSASACGSNFTINGYSAYLASNDSYNFNQDDGATGKTNATVTVFYGGSQVTVSFSFANNYTRTQTFNSGAATYTPVYAWKGMDKVINFPWDKVTPLPSTFTSQLQTLVNSISFKPVK